jgi:hypothetical protein
MSFGILKHDTDKLAALLSPDLAILDLVGVEISLEALKVFRQKRDFREKILGHEGGSFFEGDALAAGKKQESGGNFLAIAADVVWIDKF